MNWSLYQNSINPPWREVVEDRRVSMKNKIIPYRQDLKTKARELRKDSTLSEVILWCEIRNRRFGVQFHRQIPMLDYIADSCLAGRQVYCHELMLAIEIDGESHDHEKAIDYDAKRQARLEKEGVVFLRFDDKEVKQDMGWVLEEIESKVDELKHTLYPDGEGEFMRVPSNEGGYRPEGVNEKQDHTISQRFKRTLS